MSDPVRLDEAFDHARSLLEGAHRVFVLCGAGLSAEAGIPTFRGAGGLWRRHRAEDLATPEAFNRDPELVWEWYRWRLAAVLLARPHAGHHALAALARSHQLTILNQNVDGLLEEAVDLRPERERPRVLAIHGSIRLARCEACGARRPCMELDPLPLPRCDCGARWRPAVVWFGETLDPRLLDEASTALHQAELVLSVGTSAQVWPAAGVLPQALERGLPVIEINPDVTAFSPAASLRLPAPAAEALPRLAANLRGETR
jgi:NAD-dependent deacetylase